MIQRKFAVDYVGFYSSLIGHYIKSDNKKMVENLVAARRQVKEAVAQFDKILDPTKEKVEQSDIDKVTEEMRQVQGMMVTFQMEAQKDEELNSKLEKILTSRNYDIDKLVKSAAAMRGRVEVTAKRSPGIIEKWKQLSPATYEALTGAMGVGGQALKGMLGPFGNIAEGALGAAKTVGGLVKSYQEHKKTAEQKAFAGHTLLAGETAPEAFAKQFMLAQGRANIPQYIESGMDVFGAAAGAAPRTGAKKEAVGEKAGGGMRTPMFGGGIPGFGGGGVISAETVKEGMDLFFSHRAFHAGWTRDLLKAIKDLGKGGKETLGQKAEEKESAGFWGMIWSQIKKLGPWIVGLIGSIGAALSSLGAVVLPVIGVALGALALAALYKAIDAAIAKYLGKGAQASARWSTQPLGIGIGIADYFTEKMGIRKHVDKESVGDKVNKGTVEDTITTRNKEKSELMSNIMSSVNTRMNTVPVPEAATTKKVPIAARAENLEADRRTDKLHNMFTSLVEEIKKITKASETVPLSGFDAFNIRNPLISALSAGGIDIDE